MKTIVISAVNLRKGGTLTILRNCLEYLDTIADGKRYRVVALVHDKRLALYPNIEYIEIPWALDTWVNRLYCEYIYMHRLSAELSPVYLWLSLHDTTPNVRAERRAVYCHNPFPFFGWKWKYLFMNYRIVFFSWFSKAIYRINIHKDDYVVVQQEWLRESFVRMFGLECGRIVVALPNSAAAEIKDRPSPPDGVYRFIFASYADIHKNFETLCEAARLLEGDIGRGRFTVTLTIAGGENRYAAYLKRHWGGVDSLRFAGFMSRDRLYECYSESDCMVFPSKVETWGLPISEFAVSGRPMLLADLPYAHETARGSRKTAFFAADSPYELKTMMKRLVEGDEGFLSEVKTKEIRKPLTHTWGELFNILLN